jgi:hypothetical protein
MFARSQIAFLTQPSQLETFLEWFYITLFSYETLLSLVEKRLLKICEKYFLGRGRNFLHGTRQKEGKAAKVLTWTFPYCSTCQLFYKGGLGPR